MKKTLFMTALEPPASLKAKIRHIQKEFADRYGSAAALRPPVHITLSPPVPLSEQELELYGNNLSAVSEKFSPFKIELQNFGFFKKNKVLFIQVKENPQLSKIQSQLNRLLEKPDARPYHPHITVGYRKILPDTFLKIMDDYKHRSFKAGFFVKSLNLWKHEDGLWKPVKEFRLRQNVNEAKN